MLIGINRQDYLAICNLCGSFASITSLILNIYLAPDHPQVAGIALGFAILFMVGLIVFNFVIARNPPVEFLTNFRRYCKRCGRMMKRAVEGVYTIQTPADVNLDAAGDPSSRAFKNYLHNTTKRVLKVNRHGFHVLEGYRRLIVVDSTSIKQEIKKTELFWTVLQEEMQKYLSSPRNKKRGILRNKERAIPNLDNVAIGVVHVDVISKWFFSNLDIHITGRKSYVLAFQEKAVDETFWRASIHVDDSRGDITRQRLQHIYTAKIWPENADHSLRHGDKGDVVWLGKNAFSENWNWENWSAELPVKIDLLKDQVKDLITQVGSA